MSLLYLPGLSPLAKAARGWPSASATPPLVPVKFKAGLRYRPKFAWFGNEVVPRDLATGNIFDVTGTSIIQRPGSFEFTGDNTSDRIDIGSIDSSHVLSMQGAATLICDVYLASGQTNSFARVIDKSDGSGYSNGWGIDFTGSQYEFDFGSLEQMSASTNKRHRLVYRQEGPAAVAGKYCDVHEDGVWLGPNLVGTTGISSTTTNAAIGNWNHSTDREWHGKIFCVIAFDEYLPVEAARRIALGPWNELLEPANSSPFLIGTAGAAGAPTLSLPTYSTVTSDSATVGCTVTF